MVQTDMVNERNHIQSNDTHNKGDGRELRFCSFHLADRLFGIDIAVVKEVNDEFQVTRIWHAPEEISGYVNIRGQIFLVFNMRLLMGLEKKETGENAKLILFKNKILENCGILVDDVGDVVNVTQDQIEDRRKRRTGNQPVDERRRDRSNLGAGVCKLDRQLMVIIDPRNMMRYLEDKVANRT